MSEPHALRSSIHVAALLFAPLLSFGASAQTPVEPLDGLDPVLLVSGKEVDGDPAITFERGGFHYSFASTENRDRFAATPERYEIAQRGFCGRMGPPVVGNPDLFHVHEGKIYLFGSGECHRRFVANPEKYLEPAPGPSLAQSATPEDLAAGKKALEKAVSAMGGSTWDRLSSLRLVLAPTTPGDNESGGLRLLRFPDQLRLEDQRPYGRSVQIVGPTGAAMGLEGRPPMRFTEQRAREILRLHRRNLWSLLRARREPGFTVARVPGQPDRLEVELDGFRLNVTLDLATGRAVGLSYLGRGGEGEMGEVVELYSDFRPVAELTLPFTVTVTWNGIPQPGRSFTVRTVEIDPELAFDAFTWPEPKAAS